MGKKIDLLVLRLLVTLALYLYFARSFRSHTAATLLAIICSGIVFSVCRRIFKLLSRSRMLKRRNLRKSAGSKVMALACMPQAAAEECVRRLIKNSYQGDFSTEFVSAHPGTSLSQNKVFELWKAHRGDAYLAVCASCTVDAPCRQMAATLKEPKLALLDANQLAALIAENPGCITAEDEQPARRRAHAARLKSALLHRRNIPRCLLFAASMMLMYLFSANPACLISSLALVFSVLLMARQPRKPAKLF